MEIKEKIGEKDSILEFEEFRKEMNNFHLYFHPGDFGKFQREKSDLYKKFAEHNPGLEAQLRAEMKKLSDYIKYPNKIPENSPYQAIAELRGEYWGMISGMDLPILQLLYEAYLEMRKFTDSDTVLFR